MTTQTKTIVGVMGDPVGHSLSPRLHGYWLKKHKIKGEYNAYSVKISDLSETLKTLQIKGIKGVNLTVPHKEHALKIMDVVANNANKVGAVNTVVVSEQGKLSGYNTDGYGFITHLRETVKKETGKNWRSNTGPILMIGAGGAARAIVLALLEDRAEEILICNRTLKRAEKLCEDINDPRIKIIPWEHRAQALREVSLLINVTLLGMKGQPELELSLDNLPKKAVVYDIVYNPLETKLLYQARSKGNLTIDGLGMLLHQAAPAFELWFGIKPQVDEELRQYVLQAL